MTSSGEVRMVNVALEGFANRKVNAVEVLPELHKALRQAAKMDDVIAVAVAEDLSIKPKGEKKTKAIKVLFEHKTGLTVALYLPWKRKFFGAFETFSPLSINVNAEVCAWE